MRAPYYGRVVYADWLPGLGLLIVLDHGGGYMSLYGHNEQLYRRVGDRVAPGDVLAAVGEAAGLGQARAVPGDPQGPTDAGPRKPGWPGPRKQ